MARYTGPMTRKSRRLKVDLVGGDQAFERRPYPPGQHGRIRIKETEYLLQLREKQKARFTYGVLEKQFRRYYEEANRRQGKTGDELLQILESRLDNVIYRAGIARTRRHARQLVVHGHFLVNGQRVNVPSYRVVSHDVIMSGQSRPRPSRSSLPGRPTATGPCRPGSRCCPARCVSLFTSSLPGSRSTHRCRSNSLLSSTRSSALLFASSYSGRRGKEITCSSPSVQPCPRRSSPTSAPGSSSNR